MKFSLSSLCLVRCKNIFICETFFLFWNFYNSPDALHENKNLKFLQAETKKFVYFSWFYYLFLMLFQMFCCDVLFRWSLIPKLLLYHDAINSQTFLLVHVDRFIKFENIFCLILNGCFQEFCFVQNTTVFFTF